MTDKEIAKKLALSRRLRKYSLIGIYTMGSAEEAGYFAFASVRIIHHIINSINWED